MEGVNNVVQEPSFFSK